MEGIYGYLNSKMRSTSTTRSRENKRIMIKDNISWSIRKGRGKKFFFQNDAHAL